MDVKAKIELIARAFCKDFAYDGFNSFNTEEFGAFGLEGQKDKAIKITMKVAWADPTPDQTKPDTPKSFTECFNNHSPTLQQSKFITTIKTTRTFAWSMTETLNTGFEATVTTGVPTVASASAKFSASLSLSSTQTTTQSEEQDWAIEQPLSVAAESAASCTAYVRRTLYNVPFTVNVKYKGYVSVMTNRAFVEDISRYPEGTLLFKYNTNAPIFALVPAGSFFKYGKAHGVDLLDFTSEEPDSATFNVAGICTGSEGVAYDVDIQGLPVGGCHKGVKVTQLSHG